MRVCALKFTSGAGYIRNILNSALITRNQPEVYRLLGTSCAICVPCYSTMPSALSKKLCEVTVSTVSRSYRQQFALAEALKLREIIPTMTAEVYREIRGSSWSRIVVLSSAASWHGPWKNVQCHIQSFCWSLVRSGSQSLHVSLARRWCFRDFLDS